MINRTFRIGDRVKYILYASEKGDPFCEWLGERDGIIIEKSSTLGGFFVVEYDERFHKRTDDQPNSWTLHSSKMSLIPEHIILWRERLSS